ncbi:double-strand break repair protein AddB [Kordiimonas aestuarii]|uniref:double-strand break repair protein AddB n=1 Tax=Kordiimonas aestuarii TaxID=1005925 RepID=UPI0021CEF14B|nr:double-strand break repair protein AddB [Kordiimonas aestuarii]
MARKPRVYTIGAAHSFVDALATGVMEKAGSDPARLADITILVPNRRAQRSLREAFLRIVGRKPMVLPTMRPIGDVDDDEVAFLGAGLGLDPSDIPPAISGTRRQVLLMRQVMAWGGAGETGMAPAQGWRLAAELARFMDQLETEGLPFDGLKELVPEGLAHHWDITLEFLKIVSTHWPTILATEGAINPAARRDTLLRLLADLWAKNPPKGTVIAAGSTGSIPATANLLAVVARLPEGMVVLPGLERDMDDDAWEAVDASHAQGVLKDLLAAMSVNRHEVRDWTKAPFDGAGGRAKLFQDALAPSVVTDRWTSLGYDRADKGTLFQGLRKIVAPTRREEAGAIALVMREVLETPSRTAALVTPDRALARHVRAALARWGIEVDDSGGDRVLNTVPGRFLGLIADAASEGFAPVPLLALLQHPFVSVGGDRRVYLAAIRRFDMDVMRGVRPAGGLDGLVARANAAGHDKKADFNVEDLAVVEKVIACLRPFEAALANGEPLDLLLKTHTEVAEALAATDDKPGADMLWKGEDGQVLADATAELIQETGAIEDITADSYAALFAELYAGVTVRPVWRKHPRLYIWGTLEARLQRADVMILGGLNEGTWPGEIKPDPWMNRPMRKEFGLPPLERRTGQAAHDFMQAATGQEVIITRAEKVDGAPTVPSRWLFRIEALAGGSIPEAAHYLAWAHALDAAKCAKPVQPPMPRPPIAARPKRLSVTQVENWMRDPYGLYAHKVLDLKPLEPIDDRPNASTKGTLLHEALEKFLAEEGPRNGDAGYKRLIEVGRRVFEPVLTQPAVYAFWWPRFERIADWFIANEALRAQTYEVAAIEEWAEAALEGSGFTLFAKADRIDRKLDGGALTIIDYKTGNIPSAKRVAAGFAPQLPLEAWLAERGAFTGVDAAPVDDLVFWELKGGEPIQKAHRPIKDVKESVTEAEQGLRGLVKAFADEKVAYLSNPRPREAGYGDYDHLARVREWRNTDDPFGGSDSGGEGSA